MEESPLSPWQKEILQNLYHVPLLGLEEPLQLLKTVLESVIFRKESRAVILNDLPNRGKTKLIREALSSLGLELIPTWHANPDSSKPIVIHLDGLVSHSDIEVYRDSLQQIALQDASILSSLKGSAGQQEAIYQCLPIDPEDVFQFLTSPPHVKKRALASTPLRPTRAKHTHTHTHRHTHTATATATAVCSSPVPTSLSVIQSIPRSPLRTPIAHTRKRAQPRTRSHPSTDDAFASHMTISSVLSPKTYFNRRKSKPQTPAPAMEELAAPPLEKRSRMRMSQETNEKERNAQRKRVHGMNEIWESVQSANGEDVEDMFHDCLYGTTEDRPLVFVVENYCSFLDCTMAHYQLLEAVKSSDRAIGVVLEAQGFMRRYIPGDDLTLWGRLHFFSFQSLREHVPFHTLFTHLASCMAPPSAPPEWDDSWATHAHTIEAYLSELYTAKGLSPSVILSALRQALHALFMGNKGLDQLIPTGLPTEAQVTLQRLMALNVPSLLWLAGYARMTDHGIAEERLTYRGVLKFLKEENQQFHRAGFSNRDMYSSFLSLARDKFLFSERRLLLSEDLIQPHEPVVLTFPHTLIHAALTERLKMNFPLYLADWK